MQKIQASAYEAARPVLADLSDLHVAIASVLSSSIHGEIWVDNPEDPQIALVVIGDAYFLAGDPNTSADIRQDIRKILPDWAYLYSESRWISWLPDVWRNAFVLPHPRLRFGSSAHRSLPVPFLLPADFEIVPVDRALFERNPANLGNLNQSIAEWADEETFFSKAVGFCILHEGRIVCHCLTDSVFGRRCEIGVRTDPAFRRLGLGLAVASATVQECIQRGHAEIEWHTHASNKGSIAISRRIGLIELDRYTAHSCRLPAENIGDLDPERCGELAAHFEQASAQINWCRIPAAGASVLAGDHDRALENLHLLFERGWNGGTVWLEKFWALQPIADNPDFKALLSGHVERPEPVKI